MSGSPAKWVWVELEIVLRVEMREEMTSGEAGFTVTWFADRLGVKEEVGSGKELRRRRCLGGRSEVRGGMTGAVAESLIMMGKCQSFPAGTGHRPDDLCGTGGCLGFRGKDVFLIGCPQTGQGECMDGCKSLLASCIWMWE